MGRRRGNQEGSIYQRASDGRWIGAVTVADTGWGATSRKTVSSTTRNGALRKLRELQCQLDDGLSPPDASMTVAQLLERWHADVLRHQVARTASDNYKSVADHHIVPVLGRKKLKELTPGDVDRLMAQKLEAGLSVSTVRRIRSVLAQALTQGVRWGSVNRNVASLTRGTRQMRREGRTLTPSQARTLLASLRGHRNEALYSLMLWTGLRRGEALGLRWDDVDLDQGLLLVRRPLKREGGRLVVADTKRPRAVERSICPRRWSECSRHTVLARPAGDSRWARPGRIPASSSRPRLALPSTRGTSTATSNWSAVQRASGTGTPTSSVTRRRA